MIKKFFFSTFAYNRLIGIFINKDNQKKQLKIN